MVLVTVQNLITRASLLLGQLAIARILLPADFGAVALVTMISNITTALVFFGADQILQQRRHKAGLWSTQVFVLTLGFGVAGAVVMVLLGFAGMRLFHEPRLPALMAICGLATILNALWTVPQAALQWQLRFRFCVAYNSFDTVLAQTLIITAALFGLGPFSFFAPLVFTNGLRAIVFWRVSGVKLRPLRASRGWSLMIRRGMSALGSRIAALIVTQGDYFTLALFAAKPVVGAYFFAFRLASQPMALLSMSVNTVLFTFLLKVPDRDRRAQLAFQTAQAIGAVTVLMSLTVAVAAGPAMTILFGERWRPAIPLLQILCLGLPFDTIAWPAEALLLANGEYRRTFIYKAACVPVFMLFVVIGAIKGEAVGVATGVACYFVLHALVYTGATFRQSSVGVSAPAGLFGRLVVCSLVSFGPAYALLSQPALHGQLLLQLAVAVSVGPVLYSGALFLIAPEIFRHVAHHAAAVLSRYAPRVQLTAPRWKPAR